MEPVDSCANALVACATRLSRISLGNDLLGNEATGSNLCSLPKEILRKIFSCINLNETVTVAERERLLLKSFNRTSHACLSARSPTALWECCKSLKSAGDNTLTSVSFPAERQGDAILYLTNLPSLRAVAITYSALTPETAASLALLFSIRPGLATLSLRNTVGIPNAKPATDIHNVLPLWGETLQQLELDRVSCLSSDGKQSMQSLRFLSLIPGLRVLELHRVLPSLESEDLRACTALTKLILSQMDLKSGALDLSSLLHLQELSAIFTSLCELTICGLMSLKRLDCAYNSLKELDITTCRALESVICSKNFLTRLDVRGCPSVEHLQFRGNVLSRLDVCNCTLLTELDFSDSGLSLTALDLSSCSKLHKLNCSGTQVRILNLQACIQLVTISVEACGDLHTLNMPDTNNRLPMVKASGCASLTELDCQSSPALAMISLHGCSMLGSLTLLGCGSLKEINCSGCPLDSLDLSACKLLERLDCDETHISNLHLSASAGSLLYVACKSCPLLQELSIIGCSKLRKLLFLRCPLLHIVRLEGCHNLQEVRGPGPWNFSVAKAALLRAFGVVNAASVGISAVPLEVLMNIAQAAAAVPLAAAGMPAEAIAGLAAFHAGHLVVVGVLQAALERTEEMFGPSLIATMNEWGTGELQNVCGMDMHTCCVIILGSPLMKQRLRYTMRRRAEVVRKCCVMLDTAPHEADVEYALNVLKELQGMLKDLNFSFETPSLLGYGSESFAEIASPMMPHIARAIRYIQQKAATM